MIHVKPKIKSVVLSEKYNIKVHLPKMHYFSDRIDSKNYFYFVKHQHAVWDFIYKALPDREFNIDSEADLKELAAGMVKQTTKWFVKDEIYFDILKLITSRVDENILYAINDTAHHYRRAKRQHMKYKSKRIAHLHKIMNDFIRHKDILFHGGIFRSYAINKQLIEFLNKYKNRRIVIVGPPYFLDFGERAGLENYSHINIPYRTATDFIDEILEKVKSNHQDETIYLFVAGALASWFIYKLHATLRNSFMIDIGRALDIFYYEFAYELLWGWLVKPDKKTSEAMKMVSCNMDHRGKDMNYREKYKKNIFSSYDFTYGIY